MLLTTAFMKSLSLFFFAAFFSVIFYCSCTRDHNLKNKTAKEDQPHSYPLSETDLDKIQDGDIILRLGYGMASHLIQKSLNEKYRVSHIGLVCKTDTGRIVIHSVSRSLSDYDGVQADKLVDFINSSRKNSLIISRYKRHTVDQKAKIRQHAFDLLAAKKPFDNRFNPQDKRELYCTELIRDLFYEAYEIDLFSKHDDLYAHLKFYIWWDSTNFDIVLNHHVLD